MDFSALAKMKDVMDQRLSETVVEATSGGGVVTARVNGRKELLRLRIDPSVLASTTGTDIEMLEDLITAAVNEAGRKADEAMQSSAASMLGGLNIPGLT